VEGAGEVRVEGGEGEGVVTEVCVTMRLFTKLSKALGSDEGPTLVCEVSSVAAILSQRWKANYSNGQTCNKS